MSTHSLCAQKQVSCIQIKGRLRKTNPRYRDQIDKRFVKQSESSLWERKGHILSIQLLFLNSLVCTVS
jgi:hypothetical protein